MPSATKHVRPSQEHKKRHGHHHNKGPHYAKVYWPYIPLALIIILGAMLSLTPVKRWEVMAYASELSPQSLLAETNEERKANSREQLILNNKLVLAAQAKAEDMAARNYWSHNTPDGKEPWTFVANANYEYKKAGENLAYGFRNSGATISGWMNSPSHRDNLLDSSYTEVGFGYANASNYQEKGEVTIVVAMYGNPLTGPAPVVPSESSNQPEPATTRTNAADTAARPVSVLEAASTPRTAWLSFVVGLLSGVSIVFLILKQGFALRKLLLQGESYVMHHPVFDLVLLSVAAGGLLLSRTAGFII